MNSRCSMTCSGYLQRPIRDIDDLLAEYEALIADPATTVKRRQEAKAQRDRLRAPARHPTRPFAKP